MTKAFDSSIAFRLIRLVWAVDLQPLAFRHFRIKCWLFDWRPLVGLVTSLIIIHYRQKKKSYRVTCACSVSLRGTVQALWKYN